MIRKILAAIAGYAVAAALIALILLMWLASMGCAKANPQPPPEPVTTCEHGINVHNCPCNDGHLCDIITVDAMMTQGELDICADYEELEMIRLCRRFEALSSHVSRLDSHFYGHLEAVTHGRIQEIRGRQQ